MKHFSIAILICLLMVGVAFGAAFNPPTVTVTAGDVQWTEGNCTIPFTLGGRDCTVYLAVYTSDLAGSYGRVDNGTGPAGIDLDYHTVVGIDTAVYVSAGEPFTVGNRQIVWDGVDKVGRQMAPGEYTYYLIASDQTNDPIQFSPQFYTPGATAEGDSTYTLVRGGWRPVATQSNAHTQYYSASLGKLERPRWWWYDGSEFCYWEFGADTETGDFVRVGGYPEGVSPNPCTQTDPENDDVIYFTYWDSDAESGVLGKALLIPEAPAEFVTDFGEDGKYLMFGTSRSVITGGNTKNGVCMVGPYTPEIPESYLHVVDSETGELMYELDSFEWFTSSPDDIDKGARAAESGKWSWCDFLDSYMTNVQHCTCSRTAINPMDSENWLIWANMNGDYYCDHMYPGCQGFNEDQAWMCNTCTPGSYQYQTYPTKYGFTSYTTNWAGPHNMEILGPDGYGIFYFNVLGQQDNPQRWWSIMVDGDTAYDGMYTPLTTGEETDPGALFCIPVWCGFDVFQGMLTTGVGVEDGTPAAYSLSNAPDPFNPTTTISYGMAKAGHVTVDVYNIMGQKVTTLYDGHRDAGTYSVRWDASGLSNGVYFAVMNAEGFTKTEKMMLVK